MVDITGTQILAQTDYVDTDIHATDGIKRVEYMIEDAMDYVNLHAGTSIGPMTGVTPNKTVTVTGAQSAVLKPLIHLMIKAYMEKGPSANVGDVNITILLNDPRWALYKPMIKQGINRLMGRSFERV